jgi:hypothetical protein
MTFTLNGQLARASGDPMSDIGFRAETRYAQFGWMNRRTALHVYEDLGDTTAAPE